MPAGWRSGSADCNSAGCLPALQRASRTCELAGFGTTAEVDRDLVEWDYGEYEGLRTAEIRALRPNWEPFRDAFPGGETFEQIGARADRVLERVRAVDGAVLLFSHAHFLRVLAARWLSLQPDAARYFLLGTASLSTLTYEHNLSEPVIGLWNDTRHVSAQCQEFNATTEEENHESNAIASQPGPEHLAR